MAVTEIRRVHTDDIPMTKILIGERLDELHHHIHATKLTKFRAEPITIHLAGYGGPITLEQLRDYVARVQQVLVTAEQFVAEIAEEQERKAA